MKKIFTLLFILSLFAGYATAVQETARIDLTNHYGVIDYVYGFQGTRRVETTSTDIQELIRPMGSLFRVWLDTSTFPDTFNSTPLKGNWINGTAACGAYNFTDADAQVGTVLKLGMTPMISVTSAPDCMKREDPKGGTSRFQNPPRNYDEFANYSREVVYRYYADCLNDGNMNYTNSTNEMETVSCGTFSNWILEIWNEPTNHATWGGTNYSGLYANVTRKVRDNGTGIKISTAGDYPDIYNGAGQTQAAFINTFYSYILPQDEPDIFGLHAYGNKLGIANDTVGNSSFLRNVSDRYGVTSVLSNFTQTIKGNQQNVSVYNCEYNIDFRTGARSLMQSPYTATWQLNVLYQLGLTNVTGDCPFYGTANSSMTSDDLGYWNQSQGTSPPVARPVWYARKSYVASFQNGSNVSYATTSKNYVLAKSTDTQIMVINNNETALQVNVTIDATANLTSFVAENGTTYNAYSNSTSQWVVLDLAAWDGEFYNMTFQTPTQPSQSYRFGLGSSPVYLGSNTITLG